MKNLFVKKVLTYYKIPVQSGFNSQATNCGFLFLFTLIIMKGLK